MLALAECIGGGLERLSAAAQAQESALREARLEMARHLHDTTAQQLYGVALLLRECLRDVEAATTQQKLRTALELAHQAWESLRLHIQRLRQETTEVALADALRQYTADFNRWTGLPMHLERWTPPQSSPTRGGSISSQSTRATLKQKKEQQS